MEPVVSLPAGSDYPLSFDGYAMLSKALSASFGEQSSRLGQAGKHHSGAD